MTGDPISRQPVDRLIRELIDTGRQATEAEIGRIIERMATAPFDPRVRPVPVKDRGLAYQGRVLGEREDSLFYHLVKRVRIEETWPDGTTADQYLADLRQAVRAPTARLALYKERGGHIAAIITPTSTVLREARRGPQAYPNLLVIYSADRGIIVSGYQFSTFARARIPQEARWLR